MRLATLLLALALVALAVPRPASAADVTITDCTEPELDAALAAAGTGGSIFFACGGPATITVTSSKTIAGAVQISGDGLITLSGGDAARVFVVEEGGALSLDGLTIVRGRAAGEGGGILNRGVLALDTVAFVGNNAGSGGAVFTTGILTVTASTFVGNGAAADGGALGVASSGSAAIGASAFRTNAAGGTGGAIASSGVLTLTDSILHANRAALGGGLGASGGAPSVRASAIDANRATQSGGGIYNQTDLAIAQSTLSANSAAGDGGGMWNGGTLRAANLTASSNSATSGGGLANEGVLTLNNATLAANSGRGGGLFNAPIGTATLTNTIIAANADPANTAPDCAGTLATGGANLLQRADGCGFTPAPTDIVGADPRLGPLADNGGYAPTHALLAGSPAIDAGDRLSCETVDERGVGRPVGARCDIGAVEQGLVVNSGADAPDWNLRDPACETAPGNGECTLRAAIQQANGTPGVDAIEFASTGIFTLTLEGVCEDAACGPLDITDDLLLNGRGPDNTIIDGDGSALIGGVLHIAPTVRVSLAGVTIRNGDAGANTFGGNIRNEGSLTLLGSRITGGVATSGGGIANFGQLDVQTSIIADNRAQAGGGIYNRTDASVNASGGKLTLTDTTLSGNEATGVSEGGGGLDNQGGASLTNVTISGNRANRDGGGIRTQASGTQDLALNNVTLTDNLADADDDGTGDGGGIASLGGSGSTKNTIFAANGDKGGQAPDCIVRAGAAPSLISLGYNLLGNANGCAFTARPGDQVGVLSPIDPHLGPLQPKGALLVREPLTGSPAINAGSPALPGGQGSACSDTDQIGRARPEGGACDIGASEAILADVRLAAPAIAANTLVGAPLTITLDVSNAGPSATGDVQLALEASPQLALVSATPSQGSCALAPAPTCTLGALAANGDARITFVARIAGGGAISVGASARAAEADPNTANNAAALKTTARYAIYLPLVRR